MPPGPVPSRCHDSPGRLILRACMSASVLGPLLPIAGTVLADPGFAADVGLGYDFGRWRTELSYVHRQATITSSTWTVGPYPLTAAVADPVVSSNSVFASLYADLPLNSRWVHYLGAGLGYTVINSADTTVSLRSGSQSFGGGSNGLLGYQAKVGISFRASPRTDLFSEVVFQGAPARSSDSLERGALASWGLRLRPLPEALPPDCRSDRLTQPQPCWATRQSEYL